MNAIYCETLSRLTLTEDQAVVTGVEAAAGAEA